MTLLEFQKMLSPHTVIALNSRPGSSCSRLWVGEVESCDFERFGKAEVDFISLQDGIPFSGFEVYLNISG